MPELSSGGFNHDIKLVFLNIVVHVCCNDVLPDNKTGIWLVEIVSKNFYERLSKYGI